MRPGQILALGSGTVLEFYDFRVYSFFAAQIGRTFFPSSDPNHSLLLSLATFGAGFFMRPVGAMAVGRIADKVGRKPAMMLSLILMGVAVVAIALIPGHAVIGGLAGPLVVGCRLLQGFAMGGQLGPSIAYLVEVAPPGKRAQYASFQVIAQQCASLMAGVIGFTLARAITDQQLDQWGWRVAFLIGALIVPVALIIQNTLAETLRMPERAAAPGERPPPSLKKVMPLGLLLLAGGSTGVFLINYMTTYATETLHMAKWAGFGATVVIGVTGVIAGMIGGRLADRYGRKPLQIIPTAVQVLALLPMFAVLAAVRSPVTLLAVSAVLGAINGLAGGAVLTTLTESLPKRIRGGTFGVIYALAISIFGGMTQFIIAWLTAVTHNPLAPPAYVTVVVALQLCAMFAMPETAPVKQAA